MKSSILGVRKFENAAAPPNVFVFYTCDSPRKQMSCEVLKEIQKKKHTLLFDVFLHPTWMVNQVNHPCSTTNQFYFRRCIIRFGPGHAGLWTDWNGENTPQAPRIV